MLYSHGKKISDIFINGKSLERGYLNGNLIFLKTKKPKPEEEEDVLVNLWWKDDSGVITKESITTITDLKNLGPGNIVLLPYTINLSNGHSFKNTDIVDFTFKNSTNFPDTMPPEFGYGWSSLSIGSQSGNTIIYIPDKCTKISKNFMRESTFSPTEFYLNNVTSLGHGFLEGSTFNCDIDLTNVESIGDGFLKDCKLFNKPITCYVEQIESMFLYGCSAFDSPLTLINTKKIGALFLCGKLREYNIFDNTLILPNTLEYIGPDFLTHCKYSGVIDLSNTNISYIDNNFNIEGYASNVLLPTKKPLTIDHDFMRGHKGTTTSTFVIPSNVISIGTMFLVGNEDGYTFVHIQCDADPSSWPDDDYFSFTYLKVSDEDDRKLLTVTGTYTSEFIDKYPSFNSKRYVRFCTDFIYKEENY